MDDAQAWKCTVEALFVKHGNDKLTDNHRRSLRYLAYFLILLHNTLDTRLEIVKRDAPYRASSGRTGQPMMQFTFRIS